MIVYFVDTTILCNLIPVPGRDQHRAEVMGELRERIGKCTLILPVAAMIETGNFIAQLPSGGQRRTTAAVFKELLRLICQDEAPWQLHQFEWDSHALSCLTDGAATGVEFVDLFTSGLGAGDLSILAERELYKERSALHEVRIWTRDNDLSAYS